MDLAIIILNYRTAQLTLDCLASLADQVDERCHVVVVDNASDDGSAERIADAIAQRGWASWATLLRSPVNGGFAFGNNLGMRAVVADAYLLLNSDTRVCKGALAELRRALRERPDAGLIGAGLLDAEGRPDQSYFRAPAPLSELIRGARLGLLARRFPRFDPILPRSDAPIDPDWLAFAAVVIRSEVTAKIGLLDEGYFMYFEDIDYCRRARAAGFAIVYWPAAQVVHLKGGSSRVTAESARLRRAPRYYYAARARYFAKFYGRRGLLAANGLWHLGRCLSWPRERIARTAPGAREHEALDIWTHALRPFAGRATWQHTPSHEAPMPDGRCNENPRGIGLLALIAEDFRTHDRQLSEPGFWAVAVHRLGNARMDVRARTLRGPMTLGYRAASTAINWLWGIDLPYTVKLGRRVRIWHHGGIVLSARAIGDDVHIRHNTTLGVARRNENDKKPIIGNRVDIGVGSCVLGGVTVGDDCAIGANSVVVRDLPAACTVAGIPARVVRAHPLGGSKHGRRSTVLRPRRSDPNLQLQRGSKLDRSSSG